MRQLTMNILSSVAPSAALLWALVRIPITFREATNNFAVGTYERNQWMNGGD